MSAVRLLPLGYVDPHASEPGGARSALLLAASILPAPGPAAWLRTALVALRVYLVTVVRGLLIRELRGSSRRSRAFRYRGRRSL